MVLMRDKVCAINQMRMRKTLNAKWLGENKEDEKSHFLFIANKSLRKLYYLSK